MSNEKALYERVIAKPIIKAAEKKSGLVGIDSREDVTMKVIILDWGTLIDGTPFPGEPNTEATIKSDSNIIPLPDGTCVIDRRLILTYTAKTK